MPCLDSWIPSHIAAHRACGMYCSSKSQILLSAKVGAGTSRIPWELVMSWLLEPAPPEAWSVVTTGPTNCTLSVSSNVKHTVLVAAPGTGGKDWSTVFKVIKYRYTQSSRLCSLFLLCCQTRYITSRVQQTNRKKNKPNSL